MVRSPSRVGCAPAHTSGGSKERGVPFDDLARQQEIVVALKETMRLMEEIDEAIPSWPIE
jgi:hypothetical protein